MAKGRKEITTHTATASLIEWMAAQNIFKGILQMPFDTSDRARHAKQVDLARRMIRIINAAERAHADSGIDAVRDKHLNEGATQNGKAWVWKTPEAQTACARAINAIYAEDEYQAVSMSVPIIHASEIDGEEGVFGIRLIGGERAAIDFLLTYPDAGGDE